MIGYIYQIINKVDGKRYIGQTINLSRRLGCHFNKLRKGEHPNYLMQKAWNDWGEENFYYIYESFEYEEKSFLDKKEIEAILKYHSFGTGGYNLSGGGTGGICIRKLTYEDFLFIYYGCKWQGYGTKIGSLLGIDSSVVSGVLRESAHLDYLEKSKKELSQEDIIKIEHKFCDAFNIPYDREPDKNRVPTHLTEDEYFYCFCICSTYGRGIDSAVSKYFGKHKSFLYNGITNGSRGLIIRAYKRFLELDKDEYTRIGEQKFYEWEIDKYSKNKIKKNPNERWRCYKTA